MDTALALSQWTHLAVVFNGLTVQFYVNGTMVSSKSLSGSITAPLRMGADANTTQFYKGSLDNVRIYNRALTGTEVTTDMASGL
jgi:hypothetical protein